jgi:hypothetical protein
MAKVVLGICQRGQACKFHYYHTALNEKSVQYPGPRVFMTSHATYFFSGQISTTSSPRLCASLEVLLCINRSASKVHSFRTVPMNGHRQSRRTQRSELFFLRVALQQPLDDLALVIRSRSALRPTPLLYLVEALACRTAAPAYVGSVQFAPPFELHVDFPTDRNAGPSVGRLT